MLYIWFSRLSNDVPFDNYIIHPDPWFDNQGGEEYITGELEKQMIKEIDQSDVISNHLIESPILGPIPPWDLSGTVKTLILIKNRPDLSFNGSTMGDLAAPWLLKIAECQDVTIRLGYVMEFKEPLKIYIMNSGRVITSWGDYLNEAAKYL